MLLRYMENSSRDLANPAVPIGNKCEKKQGPLWKAVNTGLALSATLLVTVTEDVAC